MRPAAKRHVFEAIPARPHNLLSLLIALQDAEPRNYLSEEDMQAAAQHVNVTKARVYGMVGYYSMLSATPRGRHIIRVCRSPVCRMLGAFDLVEALERELQIAVGETTEDGAFSLEYTECLGRCTQSPAMMIDQRVYGPVDRQKLQKIIADARNDV